MKGGPPGLGVYKKRELFLKILLIKAPVFLYIANVHNEVIMKNQASGIRHQA